MMGALQAASLFGVIDLQDNFTSGVRSARNSLDGLSSHLSSVGGSISSFGGNLTAMTAPLSAAFGVAVNSAIGFDSNLKNIQAILQVTNGEADALGDQIQAIGSRSRFGASGAIEAFVEIAGGVEDASTHMAILEQSISAAQAGQADLGETTSAMIGIMNSYKFGAERASFVTDVLTQTVGMGVGSIGEFGSGLASITGLANSLNIPFDELGGAMAYLTTTGNSASQASTQLSAMMVAMLNPNEKMKNALEEAGVASGQAAIEQYGLVGAYQLLGRESATFQSQMAGTLGSTEALRGATALLADEAAGFVDTFSDSLDGLTASAEDIQMQSAAAQMDLLKSQLESLGITVGNTLLPSLQKIVSAIIPVVESIVGWVSENPELVATIGMITGALTVMGTIMIPLGMVISSFGSVIGILGGSLAFLMSPLGLVIAGVAALGLAFHNNLFGIRDLANSIFPYLEDGITRIWDTIGWFIDDISQFGLKEAILGIFGMGTELDTMESSLEGILVTFGVARDKAQEIVQGIGEPIVALIGHIENAISILTDNIGKLLSGLWAVISPSLNTLIEWFTSTGLPLIRQGIDDIMNQWITPFINLLGAIWERIQPGLQAVFDWFTGTGLPFVGAALDYALTTYVLPFIETLAGVWGTISESVGNLLTWFTETGLPLIDAALEDAKTNYLEPLINTLKGIWDTISPGLTAFRDNLGVIFNYIKDNVIQPVINAIGSIISTVARALSEIDKLKNTWGGVRDNANIVMGGLQSGQWSVWDVLGAAGNAIGAEFRDSGGPGVAGQPYMIGTGAQPEMFIPKTDGYFIPNADQLGGETVINITVTEGNAYNAGLNFAQGFKEARAARG